MYWTTRELDDKRLDSGIEREIMIMTNGWDIRIYYIIGQERDDYTYTSQEPRQKKDEQKKKWVCVYIQQKQKTIRR